MVVKMKKLSLLLYHREKQKFLKSLQELGVIHIVESPDIDSDALKKKLVLNKRYTEITGKLKKQQKTVKGNVEQKAECDPLAVLQEYEEKEKKLETIEQGLSQVTKQVRILLPWGNVEPENITRLDRIGVKIRFFEVSSKRFQQLNLKSVPHEIINTVGARTCFTVFERGTPLEINADEVKLPNVSLNSLKEELDSLKNEKSEIKMELQALTAYVSALSAHAMEHQNSLNFEKAKLCMDEKAKGSVLLLTGFLPAEKEKQVKEFLDRYSLYHMISDPAEKDNVPVLLKNSAFSKLFEPITKIFALPDYYEIDPTPFFAPFFAFFFGMCLGDVGYGLIMTAAAVLLVLKGPAKLVPIFKMGIVLGVLTMLNGLFVNTFFGEAIFVVPGYEKAFFSTGAKLAPLSAITTRKGQMIFPAMGFSIMLGIIQVILGIAIQATNKIRQQGAAWGLLPISYILIILGLLNVGAHGDVLKLGSTQIGPLPVGSLLKTLPPFLGKVFIFGGLGVMFIFNSPDKKIFVRPLLGLWELYQFASELMGNVLSYLRLFALGLASGLLGNAFNQIAFMFVTDAQGNINFASIGIIGTVFVLVFGHTLNLGLGALGSFVHPLRLTFVEFYKCVQFKGGGKAYSPFAIKRAD